MRSDLVRDEEPWVEFVATFGIVAARDELVERGLSIAKAAGIAVWLSDQASRRRLASAQTSKQYRAELRRFSPPSGRPKLARYSGVAQSLSRAA